MTEYEGIDVDVIEAGLNGQEIDEFIDRLHELKESKGKVNYALAENVELELNYLEDEDE